MEARQQTETSIRRAWRKFVPVQGGFRTIAVLLLFAIVVMLALWQPWNFTVRDADRTISVTGNATVTATPDEYNFSPSYIFTNDDKGRALSDLAKKSDEVVAKLKSLGVADKDIQTNADGQQRGVYLPVQTDANAYTLSLTAIVHKSSVAQKVQDYLLTTNPSGDVTPSATFSTALQNALTTQARDKAERDARAQAEQSAKNLGFTVYKVKSVVDGNLGTGGPIMYNGLNATASDSQAKTPELTVQPGQNDLSYSVQVVYYIR